MDGDASPVRSGSGHVVARRLDDGRTSITELRAGSPLRLVQPRFPGMRDAAAVCVVTFGGGLVDGDAIDVDLEVDAGATLVVVTQSSTKVFRGAARQSLRADVRGTLVLLPDPVACFAGASYRQRIDVALHGDGACVLMDGFTAGRPAFGERWAMTSLDLETRVTHDGALVLRDALSLDGAIEARMSRFDAMLTFTAIGRSVAPLFGPLAARGAHPRHADVVAASSELAACTHVPGRITRIAATSPALALADARRRLRNLPDIGVVDPFASRP